MNKVTGSLLRTVLKVGGAVLATIGILPEACGTAVVADPTIPAIAGTLITLGGTLWGMYQANHHEILKEEVSNA